MSATRCDITVAITPYSEQINIPCYFKEVTVQIGVTMNTLTRHETFLYLRIVVNLLTYASPPLNSMPKEVNEELTGPLQ